MKEGKLLIRDIMANTELKVRINIVDKFKIRIWIAVILFKLAGRMLGINKANIKMLQIRNRAIE